jgi:hypothetical protein
MGLWDQLSEHSRGESIQAEQFEVVSGWGGSLLAHFEHSAEASPASPPPFESRPDATTPFSGARFAEGQIAVLVAHLWCRRENSSLRRGTAF